MTPTPWISRLRAIVVAVLTLGAAITAVDAANAAPNVVAADGSALRLEVNKGSLVRPAATVFVADPEVADIQVKSPSLVYLMGKRTGETTLYAVDAREKVLANVDVSVTHNLSRLQTSARQLHPDADVSFTSIDGTIVIDGIVKSASASEDMRRLAARFVGEDGEVINRLGVTAPMQINLRVRVAEISRDIEKQLGFNWNIVGAVGGFSFGLATFNPFTVNVIQDVVTTGFGRTFGNTRWDFNALIDALEDEGLITVLAEPNLTAMSGETASFLAGGEFPILIPEGDNRVIVKFKKFGVSLAFTPTLVGETRINLHVRPEVSQLSNEGAISVPLAGGTLTIPSLTTRRAETTVELGSGQSFAIAGLLHNNVSHDIHKLPGLGDVPVLGGLFRSDRFQRNESELVIIVTPYVVRPTPNRNMATPTEGFSPPHDLERLIVGGTHRRNPVKGDPSKVGPDGRRLIGPVGFQLD